jgi:FKBP-type peptidyl-prolyl cis-trans isomerase
MRRLTAALLAPVAVTAALAGCSSSSAPAAGSNESVRVTGPAGKAPVVHIPAKKADKDLVTKTLVHGHGAELKSGDSYLANFDVYLWRGKTSKLVFSSFTSNPEVLPLNIGLSGLQRAMTGERVGSRVLAVLPPKYGYGSRGNSQIGVKPPTPSSGSSTCCTRSRLTPPQPASTSATAAAACRW